MKIMHAMNKVLRNLIFIGSSYDDQCEFLLPANPLHTWINKELIFHTECMIKHCCDSHGRYNEFVQHPSVAYLHIDYNFRSTEQTFSGNLAPYEKCNLTSVMLSL